MDRKAFYDAVRGEINLTTQNVSGFEKVLEHMEGRGTPINDGAYALATAFWETAQTMQPVREAYWLSEAWRKKNLRYYPWYGRGLIQTTWRDNYRRIAIAMGLPADTFLKNPDLLLEWEYAIPAMFVGMETGLYTGKSFDDYIDDLDESDEEDLREFINARRIVNGTDKARQIGKLALAFDRGLKAADYGRREPAQDIPPPPDIEPVDTEPPQPQKPSGWAALFEFIAAFLGGRK